MYFDAREKGDDLSGFVREKNFGQWYPDTSEKEAFARELAEAIRDQRVVWLLDGYDELTLRERGLFNQELERLDRFVLATRRIKPEVRRPSEVTLQLAGIELSVALEYIRSRYSANARSRIEAWCQRHSDALRLMASGWLLVEAAQLASEAPYVLSLAAILNRAITQQLTTHARFLSASDTDLIKCTRRMLGNLAWQILSPQRKADLSRELAADHELHAAWNATIRAPEEPPYDILRATGLLSEEANHWRFCSDLIRDEFAAEYLIDAQSIQIDLAFYPQYQRVLALWAAKLMHGEQAGAVVEFLRKLIADNEADPYGARWTVVAAILQDCLSFKQPALDSIRRQTEEALIVMWNGTSSNRLKARLTDSLSAIESSVNLPVSSPESWEDAWTAYSTFSPQIDLAMVLVAAGHGDLAGTAPAPAVHDNDVTQALIDALQLDNIAIAQAAALHLRYRDLANATILEMEQGRRPVQRLVNFALMPLTSQLTSTDARHQLKTIQTLALTVLSQPEILCNPGILRWIPDSVIHMLMASLNLRIRVKDNKPMLISVDGREHVLSSDARISWW